MGGALGPNPAHYLHKTIGVGTNGTGWNYSIYTSLGIYSALGFGTGSDQRIKNSLGQSDSQADLDLLMQLKITDYTLKDTFSLGNQVIKKVIAQEVEEVLPNAVSRSTECIPNIYKMVSVLESNGNMCKIFIKQHKFKVGDHLRLIIKDGKQPLVKIVEIQGQTLTLSGNDFRSLGKEVFVYGMQVDDFRSVDYDAISMLNVSATQQLAKDNDALKKENKGLKKEIRHLHTLFTNLEARLNILESSSNSSSY